MRIFVFAGRTVREDDGITGKFCWRVIISPGNAADTLRRERERESADHASDVSSLVMCWSCGRRLFLDHFSSCVCVCVPWLGWPCVWRIYINNIIYIYNIYPIHHQDSHYNHAFTLDWPCLSLNSASTTLVLLLLFSFSPKAVACLSSLWKIPLWIGSLRLHRIVTSCK